MKDLVIIFEALEKLGYDITGLTFNEGIALFNNIKNELTMKQIKNFLKQQ